MSRMLRTPTTLVSDASSALAALRHEAPLVQCITNSVVTGFTANALLALGASPAMVDIPGEAGPFAGVSSGLLVNLGTPREEQRRAAREAVAAATIAGTPWVLDPVAVGSLPIRTALANNLVESRPTVLRGNASEVLAVAGLGEGGRGTDANVAVDATEGPASALARSMGGVVAVSGPVDLLTDGESVVRIANGTALLTKVTGGGCALGAVIAAFLPLSADPLTAVTAAVLTYTIAAEQAAADAAGPGSFAVAFLDALAAVHPTDIATHAKLHVVSASPRLVEA
jgi:hydroxyethylthiazole kinase